MCVCVCVCVCVFYFFFLGSYLSLNLNDILHTKKDLFAYPEQIEYPNNRGITTSKNSHSILYLSRVMQEILKYIMHAQVNPAFIMVQSCCTDLHDLTLYMKGKYM